MVRSGAAEEIIMSMGTCNFHGGVQAQGCWALANLAANSGTNSRHIYENHGVDAIIGAMRLHVTNLGVQAKATRALARIARHCDASCEHIRTTGGVDAVMLAMNVNKSSTTMQQEGTEFLKIMAGEFLRGIGVQDADARLPEFVASPDKIFAHEWSPLKVEQ